MRAVVNRGGLLVVDTLPDPVPGTGQVLVRTLACGICGSDLHAVSSGMAAEQPEMVMGHEFVAEVVSFGPETEQKLACGTRIVCSPFVPYLGRTVCVGYSPELPGGFGELMLLPESMLLEVPPEVETEVAAMTEPLAVGFHAVGRAQPRDDEKALVVGCGPVGLAVIAALRMRGIAQIIASDYSPVRRALASRLGADLLINPAEQDAVDTYRKESGEKPGLLFECVGVPGLMQQLIDGVTAESRIFVVGVVTGEDVIRPVVAVQKELSLHFVFAYTADEFALALEALVRGEIDAAPLITDRVGLEEVPRAFEMLAQSSSQHAKIIVVPQSSARGTEEV